MVPEELQVAIEEVTVVVVDDIPGVTEGVVIERGAIAVAVAEEWYLQLMRLEVWTVGVVRDSIRFTELLLKCDELDDGALAKARKSQPISWT